LVSNIKTCKEFINNHFADGGGTEAVEEGFKESIDKLGWSEDARTRLLFIFLDEEPERLKSKIELMKKYTSIAAAKGIRIIPVISSAENMNHAKSMEYLMRSMALATNGNYLALTDDSGIGDEHAIPTTDAYDVEKLNTLIQRLIIQYCKIPTTQNLFVGNFEKDTVVVTNKVIVAHHDVKKYVVEKEKPIKINESSFIEKTEQVEKSKLDSVSILDNKIDTTTTKVFIDHVRREFEVKLYPNPAIDFVNLEIDGKVKDIFIADENGKIIKRINLIEESKITIEIRDLAIGVYFLKVFNGEQFKHSKFIVLK
jgi:hypothetical protein